MKQTTNTKVFMNKNVSVNLFFERIYSNIYIPKEQSAKDEKKTLEQSEASKGAEGFKQLNSRV